MKLLFIIGLSAAITTASWAIPQTFNTNGATFAAGRTFEQVAGDRAIWAPSAELPGSWSPPAADGAQKLTAPAVVFGLNAAEVQAEKSSNRLIRLRVTFRDSGKERHTLFTRVSQGIAAFTGHPPRNEGRDAKVFRYEQTQIRATPVSEGEVVVEFTPVP